VPVHITQERLGRIEREAGKQHGFLASVEKLAAAADAKQQRPATSSGISKSVCVGLVVAAWRRVCLL
jgi:hypothetical protein